MSYFRVGIICGVFVVLTGCKRDVGSTLVGRSIGEVVTNMVMSARAGETAVFVPICEPSAGRSIAQLLGMIQTSGMLTNYSSRLQVGSGAKAHLDYHDLQRGCHFQVDLEKDGSVWEVTRIWFCR